MRNIIYLSVIVFLLSTCKSKEKLDRGEAFTILQEKKIFPKIVGVEIYVADPEEAKKILNSGLEKEGLLTVQRTQSLDDIGKPLIYFTEKAHPYLLPQTEEDKKNGIQRVKIADEVLEEVSGVQILEGDKQAVVEYQTAFKNITPFSRLFEGKLADKNTRKANFALYDDGWRLEKK